MSTAKAKPPVRQPGRTPPRGGRVMPTWRCPPCECHRSLPRLAHTLSTSPAVDAPPEGMPWALLVLSLVLHQTPRYGDRCSPACCQATSATSGGLRLPRKATFRHTSTPARSGQGAAEPSGTGRPMGHRSHGRCQGVLRAYGSRNLPRRPWRACPAVWGLREPPSLTLAADYGWRMSAIAACEKARGWHIAQELTWQISRAVIADRTGSNPSGRCPRPGKDPS
jgi:hypothetical protein